MEYIEFNAIPEEESSDDEAQDIRTKNFVNSMDESEIMTPLSALLRQESVKSKYEISRQDSYKPKKAAIDTFPNIRGLDTESQKTSGGESPKVYTRRASNLLKSTSDPFKFDTDKDFLGEDIKSTSSDAVEKMFSRTTSKRSKTLNALDNIEMLNGVIQGKIKSPEMMLLTAIGTFYDIDITSRKKEPKLLDLALTVLDQVLLKHQRIICYQDDLNEDLRKLQGFLAETLEESAKIEDEMNLCKSLYQENRASFENKLKNIHHKIFVGINKQEQSTYAGKESLEEFERVKQECREAEERWKMDIEDSTMQEMLIRKERKQQKKESKMLRNIIEEISKEKEKKRVLKRKIEICTESLWASRSYLNESKLKKNFAQEFTELLQELEKEIIHTGEAEKEFRENALSDPKTKILGQLTPELVLNMRI